jgi:hypothetical protein
MKRKARYTLIISLPISVFAAGLIAAWIIYQNIGKTPAELMDYAQRRLEGHPRLEYVVLPTMQFLRKQLDAPSRADRYRQAFIIPPPPKLYLNPALNNQSQFNPTGGKILRVGSNGQIPTIAAAAKLAKDGDIVEIQAGEYYGDVAQWPQKLLTIRGVGGNARIIAAGKNVAGKGIWVIQNGHFTVENIDFIGAQAYDKNGAGIRFENGHLIVRNCLFYGNQNGILANSVGGSTLEIENSEFGYNGAGDGFSHNLYVGQISTLKVTGSYFHHANIGHLLKSRAAKNDIRYNRLTDEDGGRASYELDLPNGGVSTVIGNLIQQNRATENSTIIAFGEEGYAWPNNALYLSSNTIVNDHPQGGAFLRAAPGAQKIVTANNLLAGMGKYLSPQAIKSLNDNSVTWSTFVQPSRQDYRLNRNPAPPGFQIPDTFAEQQNDLVPSSEYRHPRQLQRLTSLPHFAGALQTP